MELDLQCVASFVVLSQELHFGRAASRQHLTTSALSKRISRLEVQVGVRVVVRGPAGVLELTAAGRRLAAEAVPLLAQARAVRNVAQRESAAPVVVLGVIGEIGYYPTRRQLVTLGGRLRRHRPSVRLLCRSVPMAELTGHVVDGQVDVLCGASPVPHRGVHLTPLAELGRTGVVATGHPLSDAGEVPVEVFAELPMLYDPDVRDDWMHWWYLGDVRPAADAELVRIRAPDNAGVLRQVAGGLGVSTMIGALATDPGPRLRSVRLTGCPPAVFSAARRSTDRRHQVLALVTELQTLLGGGQDVSHGAGQGAGSDAAAPVQGSPDAGRPFASVL